MKKSGYIYGLIGLIIGVSLLSGVLIGIFYKQDTSVDYPDIPAAIQSDFNNVRIATIKNQLAAVPFLSPDGEEVSWNQLKGHYLLVNFWATWCAPCVVELPSLSDLQKKLKDLNVKVIAVSLDHQKSHAAIQDFLYQRNLPAHFGYHDHQQHIMQNLNLRGIPSTYLLSPNGSVMYIFEGDADWAAKKYVDFFTELLDDTKEY